MLQIRFAHVVKALAGHCRILNALFFGDERQHRIHQRALAGGARRLHHNGQRRFQMTAHRGQITNQLIGLFADNATAFEVFQNAIQQLRILQELERRCVVFFAHADHWLRCFQCLLDLLIAQLFQLQKHTANVLANHVFLHMKFFRRTLDEGHTLPVLVHVQRVHMELFLP